MIVLQTGLCLLMAFAVLAFGAVQPWSQSILEIGAAVLLLLWGLLLLRNDEAKIQFSPLTWPILGLLLVGGLQLLFKGTAYAYLTRLELLRLLTYCIVFFLLQQAFAKRAERERLAWFLIAFCFAVSLLGIIQHFTAQNQIYWLSSLIVPNDSFGPFVNRNHFAGFVELTLPTGLAMIIFRGIRRDLFPLVILLSIVPMGALILSGSRGGIIGFGFELCVLAVLAKSKQDEKPPRMAAIGVVALAAIALIAWLGADKAIERFSDARKINLSMARRVSMSSDAAKIFVDHPIKGVGLGALAAVYPRYETVYDGNIVEHVHNDYLEGLAETGIVGGICGLGFLWLLYWDGRKALLTPQGHFSRGLHAAAIAAVSGLLLHSLLDFNLHIPSNALLFLCQAFLATSSPLPSRSQAPAKKYVRREVSPLEVNPA